MNRIKTVWRWLADLWTSASRTARATVRGTRYVEISRFNQVTPKPPPGFWAPCHPATAAVFKASMTCPSGHSLTLRNHWVSADGRVQPSVVCPARTCSFHEFVRLRDWSFGDLAVRR